LASADLRCATDIVFTWAAIWSRNTGRRRIGERQSHVGLIGQDERQRIDGDVVEMNALGSAASTRRSP
jgi:hypothetical protein